MLIDDDGKEEKVTLPPDPPFALKSPFRFGVRMLGVIFLLKITLVLLVLLPLSLTISMGDVFAEKSATEIIVGQGMPVIIFTFFYLPIETFLGQGGPIWLFSKFGVNSHRVLCVLSAICFGLLHLSTGLLDVFNGFIAGLVLSHCWLSWRPGSLGLAFWGTTFVHVTHNGVALVFFGLLSGLGSDPPPKPSPGKEPPAYMDRSGRTGVMQTAAGETSREPSGFVILNPSASLRTSSMKNLRLTARIFFRIAEVENR